jgi:DNA polymerase-3 subunit epsilon
MSDVVSVRVGRNNVGLLDWLLGRGRKTGASAPEENRRSSGAPAFAVIDVETTGLSPKRDRVLELAVVRLDAAGHVVDEATSRFNPEGPVGATHIHGIRDVDVENAPLFRDQAHDIASVLSGLPIIAHNAKFDLAFLRAEFTAAGWSVPWLTSYCTLTGSHAHLPSLDRRRLIDCCWAIGTDVREQHSALGDARATAELFRSYLAANRVQDDELQEVRRSGGTIWPSGPSRAAKVRGRDDAAAAQRETPIRFTTPRLKQPPLLRQLSALTLLDVIDEGAPTGTTAYLELLFDALEDGDVSNDEAEALESLRIDFELSVADVHAAHEAFLLALAHRAVHDGVVTRDERRELTDVAHLLSVDASVVKRVLDRAETARHARLGADLGPLPEPWPHGEPLRVGDKIAFTGCDDEARARLEKRADELGVRVMGNVSRLTVLLVTDGSYVGIKREKAAECGTRIVEPDVFEHLLTHLQPSTRAGIPVAVGPRRGSGASTPGVVAPVPTPSAGERITSGEPSPGEVRTWALANGYTVGVRGRLPSEVREAYALAHSERA